MIWFVLAGLICIADLGIKRYIEESREINSQEAVLGGRVIITRFHNPGAMLGGLKDQGRILMGITLVFLGMIAGALLMILGKKENPLLKLGLSLLLGGALSNGWERWSKGQVTDYFKINCKPLKRVVFNLGDMFIFAGCFIGLMAEIFFGDK